MIFKVFLKYLKGSYKFDLQLYLEVMGFRPLSYGMLIKLLFKLRLVNIGGYYMFLNRVIRGFESLALEISAFIIFSLLMLMLGFSVGQALIIKDANFMDVLSAIGSIGLLFVALMVRYDYKKNLKYSLELESTKKILHNRNKKCLIKFSSIMTQYVGVIREIHEGVNQDDEKIYLEIRMFKEIHDEVVEIKEEIYDLIPEVKILSNYIPLTESFNKIKDWLLEVDDAFCQLSFLNQAIEHDLKLHRELKVFLGKNLTSTFEANKDKTLDGFVYGGGWGELWNDAAKLGKDMDDSALNVIKTS